MKRILFLLLLTVSVYGQNPSRFAKIQIKGNTNSGTATKVNVQEASGEVNTQTINTGFNKNIGLGGSDVVGANTLLNQYSTTPVDWTATAFNSGQVVFYAGKQWIAKMATVAGDVPSVSSKWDEITFEALANKTTTVDQTIIDGSTNAVSGNAVFDGLALKSNIGHTHVASQITDLSKASVGLGNVDNTSDLNKIISTATQTALNAKANISGQVFTGAVSATNLSGTNTGDNAPNSLYSGLVTNATHTGEVTGSTALTITNGAVTNSKLANVATSTLKGRVAAATGVVEDLTASQVRTLLNVADGANNYVHPANHLASIITQDASNRFVTDTEKSAWNAKEPAIASGTISQYWRGDKTWQPFPAQATVDQTIIDGSINAVSGNAVFDGLKNKLNGSNYPDYVAQNSPISISSSTYQSFPLMLRSNYGKVLLFYRDGANHAASKGVVKMRISEDGGGDFGGETTIATDAIYDCRNVSGGVTPTGRIVLFYMRYNFTASTSVDQGLIYSDDDGNTWSSYQTIPSGTHTFFSPYGNMISIGNGKLMANWYGETPATPTYSTYIVTSSDNGLTWSSAVAVATSTTLRYGESSYAYLDGGVIVGHVRNSIGSPLYQVISTNNGATWTNQGVTTVDTAAQVSPMLATFIDPNNQKYIASFYANRGDNKLNVAMAEYATAIAGVSGWTRTDIDSHTSTDFGYPTFIKSRENNKFLIAYYKATSTTLASIYFKNYTPNYGNIAVTGTISSTGDIFSSANISAIADVSSKDLKSSNTLQIKGVVSAFPTSGNGLEAYNSTATASIIQSYNRTSSIFNALNFRGSLLQFYIGAAEAMRIHASKGVSIGNTTDLGAGTLNVAGNITTIAATTANQVPTWGQVQDAARPYKVYTALLSQTGTNAPTATVLENTLGGNVVWSRSGVGTYTGTLTGAFVTNKTIGFQGGSLTAPNSMVRITTGINNIQITTNTSTATADNLLGFTSIEIRVYK